jgi:IS30 family transposase
MSPHFSVISLGKIFFSVFSILWETRNNEQRNSLDLQRGILEAMTRTGNFSQDEMAKELNVSQSTISRELQNGRTCQMSSN